MSVERDHLVNDVFSQLLKTCGDCTRYISYPGGMTSPPRKLLTSLQKTWPNVKSVSDALSVNPGKPYKEWAKHGIISIHNVRFLSSFDAKVEVEFYWAGDQATMVEFLVTNIMGTWQILSKKTLWNAYMPPNNSFERTNPRALASLGRCGWPLNSGVGRHKHQ